MSYIHCDCSDCGFARLKGPCLLEEYYTNKSHIYMDNIRKQQQQTQEYKNYEKMCERVAGNKFNFVSVLQVTRV
jgi:hypothetical protein